MPRGISRNCSRAADSWTNFAYTQDLWRQETGGWSNGWLSKVEAGDRPWYVGRRWKHSDGWHSKSRTWTRQRSWRWHVSAWHACCESEKQQQYEPVPEVTSDLMEKRAGLGSGMSRWDRGRGGGQCSSGKCDSYGMEGRTCRSRSMMPMGCRRTGRRWWTDQTSCSTGGMLSADVGQPWYGIGEPGCPQSFLQEAGHACRHQNILPAPTRMVP